MYSVRAWECLDASLFVSLAFDGIRNKFVGGTVLIGAITANKDHDHDSTKSEGVLVLLLVELGSWDIRIVIGFSCRTESGVLRAAWLVRLTYYLSRWWAG